MVGLGGEKAKPIVTMRVFGVSVVIGVNRKGSRRFSISIALVIDK